MDAVGGRCQIVYRATFGQCPLDRARRVRNKSCLRPAFACATPRILWSFLRAAHRCVVHVCFCCLLWRSVSTNASLVVISSSPSCKIFFFFVSFAIFRFLSVIFTPIFVAVYLIVCYIKIIFSYTFYILKIYYTHISRTHIVLNIRCRLAHSVVQPNANCTRTDEDQNRRHQTVCIV
jgi:hypothetical protein